MKIPRDVRNSQENDWGYLFNSYSTKNSDLYISVSGQNSVQITVSSNITLNRDDLNVTCSGAGNYDSITLYAIKKNVPGFATLQTVVKKQYSVSSQSVFTTWGTFDNTLQNRAGLTGVDPPSAQATMTLTIPRDQVICPDDAGGYVCTYSSTPTAGSTGITTDSESDQQFVSISSKNYHLLTPNQKGTSFNYYF